MSNNYRCDLIWRSLVRLFRRWLKKEALSFEQYDALREKDFMFQGKLFCEAIGLTDEIANTMRNQMAVLFLISSHRIIWRKHVIPSVVEII